VGMCRIETPGYVDAGKMLASCVHFYHHAHNNITEDEMQYKKRINVFLLQFISFIMV
jgi:hypothetical protein